MPKNILSADELVRFIDFERLKRCNEVCLKWTKSFGIRRARHVAFMNKLMRDVGTYAEMLPEALRGQFAEDCAYMFYAGEIEAFMISQFHPMVISILAGMNLSREESEHHETDGLLAVRMATWGFKKHETNATFVTYVYRSIFNCIRAARRKMHEKRERRQKKVKILNIPDYTKIKVRQPVRHDYCDIESEIRKVAEVCRLNSRESDMLMCFARREDEKTFWYEGFGKKYKDTVNKMEIRNELRRLQTKVYFRLKESGFVFDGYVMPRMRSKQVL